MNANVTVGYFVGLPLTEKSFTDLRYVFILEWNVSNYLMDCHDISGFL